VDAPICKLRFELMRIICAGLTVVVISALPTVSNSAQTAPAKSASDSNAAKGRNLFTKNCAACHGSTGQGGEGPNLHGLKLSDGKITSTINDGFKGEMPAFKSKLKSTDIRALIAYIRSLKK